MKMLLLPEISCGAGGRLTAYAASNTIRMGGTLKLDSILLIKHDAESWNQGYIYKLSPNLVKLRIAHFVSI